MGATSAFPRRRFTVEQYERMAEAGVLGREERVELLDGEVVEMPPIGPPHASRVDRCSTHLWRALGAAAIVRVQSPLRLSDLSLPEPDITVLRPRDDFYASNHPTVADVLLVVEVGDTSARFDRDVKLPLYATAGVFEVWLLDVNEGTIGVFRGPADGGYRTITTAHHGTLLQLSARPDMSIAVSDLLG